MGTGTEDGGEGGKTDCADAAPLRLTAITKPRKEKKADFIGHPACRLRSVECHAGNHKAV